jgi:uncharacterized protein
LIRLTWPPNSGRLSARPALYSAYFSVRNECRDTSNATVMWVGFSSRNTLMSMEVNPYTAFVGCPVVVEKFSTGSAKNARYARECPSSSSRRGVESFTVRDPTRDPRHSRYSTLDDCDSVSAIMAGVIEDKTSAGSSTAAELVRVARARRRMSQRELADRAGVPQSTVSAVESGQRQPTVLMLERLLGAAGFHLETKLTNAIRPSDLLDLNRDRVLQVLSRYPIQQAWVFGSVARGDDRPDSDLDLLVDLTADATPLDAIELQEELSATLSCSVDVVTTRELESNELFRRRVQRDLRQLRTAA